MNINEYMGICSFNIDCMYNNVPKWDVIRIINNSEKVNQELLQKTKPNSVPFSPQANYTDWATATCRRNFVPTFADIGVSRFHLGGSPTVVNSMF
jgi:hypothetical protein